MVNKSTHSCTKSESFDLWNDNLNVKEQVSLLHKMHKLLLKNSSVNLLVNFINNSLYVYQAFVKSRITLV